MKMKALLLLGALAMALPAAAQVKIGNNPQAIDPASLLELESSDQVLVITRISTAQMEAITPSPGAVVYNTDAGCLYYYNGAQWVNICESLPVTFTAEAIVNPAPSIVITQAGDTLNFEVALNAIRSENIVDFTISSQDIQNNAINDQKLAPNSVGTEELQDNAVTDNEMNYNQINITNFNYNNTSSGLTATNVQAALDELAVSAGTVSMVDNGDGSYDFTDASGNVTIISDTSISTLVDNNDGTYTYTDETGQEQVINTNGLDITDTVTGNLIATIAQANGNSTAVNESVTTLSTADAETFTYTSEDGTPTSFIGTDDQSAQEVAYDDTATSLGAATVQEAIVALNTGSTDDQTLANDPLIPGSISIEDGNAIVINVEDADADITNELTLVGTSTPPPLAGTNAGNTYVDTSTGQLFVWDGAGWIPVGGTNAADNDPDPTNELQDPNFTAGVITLSGDPTPTSIDLSGYDSNAADDFDGQWGSLAGVPPGFLDGIDNDSQLDEAAVDAFVANNGFLTAEVDGSTTNELQDLDFTSNVITLSGDPTPTSIDLNGYDTNAADDFDGQWGSLLGLPAGFQDGIDNDTQLDEAAVDAFVANNGYLTTEVDGSITNELQDLNFTSNIITLSGDPTPTSIDLSGFDTNAADDFDGQWGNLLGVPAGFLDGIDNDTQLDEAAVDAFVANNGFLSTITVDGNTISGNGTTIPLTVGEISGGPTGQIVANSITQGDIDTDAVGNGELRDNSVGTSELQDQGVTPAKLEPSATDGQVLTTLGGAAVWASPESDPIVAWAKWTGGGGISKSSGIGTISNIGFGVYQVTLNTARTDANYTVLLTSLIGDYRLIVGNQTNSSFNVLIRNGLSDAPENPAGGAGFFVNVIDN